MHSRRSFLAFAAAAQLLGPLARAMPVRDCGPVVARLPQVLLQEHAGRDVYFCNDPMSGRLAILNLQYADSTSLRLPPARQPTGAGVHEAYLYSLTMQRSPGSPAALRRYMDALGKSGGWPPEGGGPQELELLRLRMGMYTGS